MESLFLVLNFLELHFSVLKFLGFCLLVLFGHPRRATAIAITTVSEAVTEEPILAASPALKIVLVLQDRNNYLLHQLHSFLKLFFF